MKKVFFIVFILNSFSAFSQDQIFRHDKNSLIVKVLAINDYSISYTYPSDGVTNTIGKAAVSKIKFESGREEFISDKIDVSGKTGWENVIITNNPNDVVGLRRIGEIKSKAGGYWSMRSTKGSDRKATERIKKEAVELGGHIVYLQQHQTKGRGIYSNPESIQSGVAYGY